MHEERKEKKEGVGRGGKGAEAMKKNEGGSE